MQQILVQIIWHGIKSPLPLPLPLRAFQVAWLLPFWSFAYFSGLGATCPVYVSKCGNIFYLPPPQSPGLEIKLRFASLLVGKASACRRVLFLLAKYERKDNGVRQGFPFPQ